mmetsp:Transcript_22615/g.62923  ORF Transcript_22615/g.62923 Transcript_22615/m.62923 type:complete len:388 (+) Transcript_22615:97-1260(+)
MDLAPTTTTNAVNVDGAQAAVSMELTQRVSEEEDKVRQQEDSSNHHHQEQQEETLPLDEDRNNDMEALRHNSSNYDDDEDYENTTTTTTSYWQSPQCRELGACVVFMVLVILFEAAPLTPHQRPIPFQWLDNSQDYVRNLVHNEEILDETIPDALLIVLGKLLPLSIQATLCWWQQQRYRHHHRPHDGVNDNHDIDKINHHDLHSTWCAYSLATGLNLLATEAIKLYVGYLRPIFYERCQPTDTYDSCQNDDGRIDARKSFVSGHASLSFCGLTLLTLYLHHKWGMGWRVRQYQRQREQMAAWTAIPMAMRQQQQQQPRFQDQPPPSWNVWVRARIISVLALLPMALALFIATSRIHDNRHFPADVVGGAVLGASVANYVHGLYFFA